MRKVRGTLIHQCLKAVTTSFIYESKRYVSNHKQKNSHIDMRDLSVLTQWNKNFLRDKTSHIQTRNCQVDDRVLTSMKKTITLTRQCSHWYERKLSCPHEMLTDWQESAHVDRKNTHKHESAHVDGKQISHVSVTVFMSMEEKISQVDMRALRSAWNNVTNCVSYALRLWVYKLAASLLVVI